MNFRTFHRRSTVHALAAWLCVALHLALFTASGWHSHGPGGYGLGGGGAGVSGADGPAGCCCDDARDDPTDRGSDERSPRDGRDPDGCCICKAILALHHAAIPPPIALPAALPGECDAHAARPQVAGVALLQRERTRGPPMTDA